MLGYRNLSVGFQLRIVITFCFVMAFVAVGLMVYKGASQVLLDTTLNGHKGRVEALAKTLSGEYDALLDSAEKLESSFYDGYLHHLEIPEKQVPYRGVFVNNLSLNGESLIENSVVVDRFTKATGAVATIFSATGNDFIRITTSLKNEQGLRAIGTMLGTGHPGYNRLINGQPYSANVKLFGKSYISYYSPIRLANGKIAGLSFIGLPLDKATENVFEKLRHISWGETGYTIVMDNNEANLGQYLLHPVFTEKDPSIIDVADHDGNRIFRQIFDSLSGVITFSWEHNGLVGEKYLVYAVADGWNWKIAGGTFVDEVTVASKELLMLIALVSAIVGLMSFVLISLVLNRATRPIVELTRMVRESVKNEFQPIFVSKTKDEIGQLSRAFNESIDQIQQNSRNLEEIVEKRTSALNLANAELEIANSLLNEKNRILEEIASKDSLTDLYNRRAFNVFAEKEISRVKRHGVHASIILIDIDHFKAINDTYGHDVGDRVLSSVAEIFTRYSRKENVICRWGGEEFIVLIPEATTELAYQAATILSERVKKEEFGPVADLTFSAGVASYRPGESLREWVHRADVALYEAKSAGRNCIKKAQ